MAAADRDLNSQQEHLSSTSYDLRITNLARFIYSRIRNEDYVIPDSDRESMDPRMREDDKRLDLLDVGAGNGLFLKFFKSKGFAVSGYELEQKNVDNMKKDPVLKSVSIVQADITNLRGSENFDVVMASDVIEHIKDDVLAIKNLWSFVKPDGTMLITVPAHSYLYGKRDEKWGHHRRYDKDMLIDHIRSAISNSKFLISKQTPNFKLEFLTQWNIVGFYTYFLFEKILHKPISENMRYSNTFLSRSIRFVLDRILRLEEMIGGLPLGLTLIVGVRKTASNKR